MRSSEGKATIGSVLLAVIVVVGIVLYIRHSGEIDDAKHIEAVLAQDKSISEALNGRMQEKTENMDFDQIAGYFDDFVERERNIDTHACPREFAEAYSRYVSAFSEEALVLHAHPQIPSGAEAFVAGFIKGLQGDPMGEARAINDSLDAWAKKWREKADRATQAEKEMKDVADRYEGYAWPRWS